MFRLLCEIESFIVDPLPSKQPKNYVEYAINHLEAAVLEAKIDKLESLMNWWVKPGQTEQRPEFDRAYRLRNKLKYRLFDFLSNLDEEIDAQLFDSDDRLETLNNRIDLLSFKNSDNIFISKQNGEIDQIEIDSTEIRFLIQSGFFNLLTNSYRNGSYHLSPSQRINLYHATHIAYNLYLEDSGIYKNHAFECLLWLFKPIKIDGNNSNFEWEYIAPPKIMCYNCTTKNIHN